MDMSSLEIFNYEENKFTDLNLFEPIEGKMTDRLKRTNDELKADRPTIDEIKLINRTHLHYA